MVNQSYDFTFGSFDKPVESRVMLLHASVTNVVTDSARKLLEPRRPVRRKNVLGIVEDGKAASDSCG
jgi:hypothetical protein